MKKVFLVGAIALFGAMNAQTFGLKAGMNVSSVSESGTKSKVGFYGGVLMNAPIASSFSIQPEVLYSGKGFKVDSGIGDVTGNLDYISIPVMIQYNVVPQFYLEAGPEFSFLISANAKGGGASVDVKDSFNGFDVGVGLGAGYYFIPSVGINARYVAGFTDIVKNNPGSSVKNGVFQVGLTYKFMK
ncbi:PorT family protein [Kaistella sp. G5-32]|uniref:PorT family protein n=1 Tax=Kaistella gelatinilytica TaxID=2787636 RepID=A0ABS0F816_9FLAO|nr:porin family protein [Kaistella gelatinilytica]MBF8455842.1 PorT family protein [Kaistella gelatinilytica]